MALVAVLMGSKSDMETMQACMETLTKFGIEHEVHVMSAHRIARQRARVRDVGARQRLRGDHRGGRRRGRAPRRLQGVHAAARHRRAARLERVKGIDALYSIVQMPPGMPVATVAVGSWGARNAATLAAEILSLSHEDIRAKYDEYRAGLAARIEPALR